MLKPAIQLNDVHVLYGHILALDIEELSIDAGERVFILGRSAAGKSTLSRLIKGRIRSTTGIVSVLDFNPANGSAYRRRAHQRRIAMIDQEFFLIPRLSVIENILTGCLGRVSPARSLIGWYPQEEWDKAQSIMCEVDLEGLDDRRVEDLSGGQRQRTAIGRALMQEAEIILADEPISNLDPELAEDALELLVECVRRRGVTLGVNLHQPSLAVKFASRIIGLADGKVVYDGSPEGFTETETGKLYSGKKPMIVEDSTHDKVQTEMEKENCPPDLRVLSG